jgi:hypothetical protein
MPTSTPSVERHQERPAAPETGILRNGGGTPPEGDIARPYTRSPEPSSSVEGQMRSYESMTRPLPPLPRDGRQLTLDDSLSRRMSRNGDTTHTSIGWIVPEGKPVRRCLHLSGVDF